MSRPLKKESRLLLLYGGRWSTLALVMRGGIVDTLSVLPPSPPEEAALTIMDMPFIREVRKVIVHSPNGEWADGMKKILGASMLSPDQTPEWVGELIEFAGSLDSEIARLGGGAD